MREKLPQPVLEGNMSLEEVLFKRRSVRKFQQYDLSKQQISQLLWAGYGVTDKHNMFKTTPSAGATYPLEIYYLDKTGIFHYIPEDNSAVTIKEGDLRKELVKSAFQQEFISEASINIIICALYERTTLFYGERGYKYVLIEVGHCAQNICLQAVSLGLDSVCVGAFDENEVKKLLMLEGDLEPVYIVSIGKKK